MKSIPKAEVKDKKKKNVSSINPIGSAFSPPPSKQEEVQIESDSPPTPKEMYVTEFCSVDYT
jgi:hypothetical protein